MQISIFATKSNNINNTMLNLNKLEEITAAEIWDRGEDYFLQGWVNKLRNKGNDWSAIVEGSHPYRVRLLVEDNILTHWDCNCPYEHGPVCKHVVAVALAVEEQEEIQEPEVLDSTIKTNEIKVQPPVIIKDIPTKDLKRFCEKYAKDHPEFEDSLVSFLSRQAPKKKSKTNYSLKIKKAADRATGGHDFIDYYHAPKAFNVVFDLLYKAENLLEKKGYEEAFEIAKAVFEEVSEMCQYMDDSDGMTGDSLEQSQEIFFHIINSDTPSAELKNKVFIWLMDEYPKEKYKGFLGDDMLLDMLIDMAKNIGKVSKIFPLIERALSNSDSKWGQENLLLQKLDLLKFTENEQEADKLIEQHLHFPKISKIKLGKLLFQQKYRDAEMLIKEGIEIARKDHHYGTEIDWHKALLDVYIKTKDIKQQLTVARWLFENDSNSRTEHLKNLKAFFTPEQWIIERNELIAGFKKDGNRYLFDFYTHEKMWEELLALLKKNPYLHQLKQYSKFLFESYRAEILEMFAVALHKEAEMAGNRKNYKALAKDLTWVKKLKGGSILVKQLLSEFREKYKKRPAMIDELSIFK